MGLGVVRFQLSDFSCQSSVVSRQRGDGARSCRGCREAARCKGCRRCCGGWVVKVSKVSKVSKVVNDN